MKKYINTLLALLMVISLGACSKEALFDGDDSAVGEGRLLTDALSVSLANENGPKSVKTRRVSRAPEVADFDVAFLREGNDTPEATYKYSEMPEIITLPAGSYVVRASYGDNPSAAWESPYYMGESSMVIVADEITDEVDPVVCKFSNVRVSIEFDAKLRQAMGSDAKVTVKVGESGSLDFTVADEERSGYFAYVENSHTLAATFTGTVDGYLSSETKTYDNVAPGTHYRITFRLHDAGEEDPGFITGDDIVVVDASVESEDMNKSVDSGETNIVDDMRPKEDEEQGGETPTPPVGDDKPAPSIEAVAPYSLDAVNRIEIVEEEGEEPRSKYPVELIIESEAEGGIIAFEVVIDSTKLTPEELEGVELSDKLDLVNTSSYPYGDRLAGLGFPTNVGGQKHVEFKITGFVPLLAILDNGEPATHKFILTVTDANGTTTRTLILQDN